MRIANAKLYEEEIKRNMWNVWYDENFQYYFGNRYRNDFKLSNDAGSYDFAVIDESNNLIGYIGYYFDIDTNVISHFGAINFSDNKLLFGKAMFQVIEDCFLRYGANVLEWCVVCGNPIEKTYDKLSQKYGGRIVGIKKNRSKTLDGELRDMKIYEILREDFISNYKHR